MFQDFDLAIRKDYRWPTRKPVRAPCIRPSLDIAGNRVGWEGQGHRVENYEVPRVY